MAFASIGDRPSFSLIDDDDGSAQTFTRSGSTRNFPSGTVYRNSKLRNPAFSEFGESTAFVLPLSSNYPPVASKTESEGLFRSLANYRTNRSRPFPTWNEYSTRSGNGTFQRSIERIEEETSFTHGDTFPSLEELNPPNSKGPKYFDLPVQYRKASPAVPKVPGPRSGMASMAVGMGLQAASGAVGSLISGAFSLTEARERNDFLAKESSLSRQWESSERQTQRAYGTERSRQDYLQARDLQRDSFDYGLRNSQQLTAQQFGNYETEQRRREDTLRSAGLPGYLAFTGGAGGSLNMPMHSQMLLGSNRYTSHFPGNPESTPYTGSLGQNLSGWGKIPTNISL